MAEAESEGRRIFKLNGQSDVSDVQFQVINANCLLHHNYTHDVLPFHVYISKQIFFIRAN